MKNRRANDLKNCLGILEIGENRKEKMVASASMIKGDGKIIIATAAHCAYDYSKKQFYEKLVFRPFVTNMKKKYNVKAVFLHNMWTQNSSVEYDTCFLYLEDDITKEFDYDAVAIKPQFNLPCNLEYYLLGLPLFAKVTKHPYITVGNAIKDTFKHSSLQGVICKNKSCMSGGPWITEYNGELVQNSMSILSFKFDSKYMWGPYWGPEIKKVYTAANDFNIKIPNVVYYEF